MSGLHPFHDEAERFDTGGCVAHTFVIVVASPLPVEPSRRPLTHSAMATRCSSVRLALSACVFIVPVVIDSYSFSGVSCLSISGDIASSTLGLPWHDSHTLPKIVAPAPSDARSANARGSVVDEAGCCCARTASECETIATATANDITTTIAAVFMVSSTSEEGTH